MIATGYTQPDAICEGNGSDSLCRFGAHLALPLMREAHKKWGSAMTKAQVDISI